MLPAPLAPLAAWPQFVAWRLEWNEERGVWGKIPYSPITGRKASSTNPADWSTYEIARAYADSAGMAGVGFVFTAADPFFFLDVDKALDNGHWSQVAQEACALAAGAAVEVSQSGVGLHVIGRYSMQPVHRNKNTALGLELYTQERFVALTGTGAVGDAGVTMDGPLAAIVAKWFVPVASDRSDTWTTEPCAEWSGPEDDDELLAIALRSTPGRQVTAASAFGAEPAPTETDDGPTFAQLWAADVDALARKWPGNSGAYDASSADQSLANMLAFWTGKNCERIDRMMRRSSLARAKWDDRPDYLETTILKATAFVRGVYSKGASKQVVHPVDLPTPQQVEEAGFGDRQGLALLSHSEQVDYFARCVYVVGINRVLTPRGELLDQARFNATYGGYEFIWYADGRKTTTSAWTAFTEAQTFVPPRADRLCFRPEHGSGGIIVSSGKRLANAYVKPEPIDAKPGDPSKFLNHMAKMLPEGDDLEILLSYMACAAQNPGRKIQWWPVVQGAEGNFKSTLLRIMSCAVGWHYAHTPNTRKMVSGDMNFNGWIDRKLFLGLDEVYAANRREFFEGFKTTVTNLEIPIEGKGIEETTGDNRANGMIITNHQDGVPITEKSRRYGAFFCAQQAPEDLIRDGMDAAYISDMHAWLMGLDRYAHLGPEHGIRVMAHHLLTREIQERFNPLGALSRAPKTSSTEKALAAGLGSVEQAILEAIEETNLPGFRGGWVSGHHLKMFLDTRRDKIPRNGRRALMQNIGYDWHPALEKTKGQVTQDIAFDGGARSRIYCKVGSIMWNELKDSASIVKAYETAQQKPMDTAAGAFASSS